MEMARSSSRTVAAHPTEPSSGSSQACPQRSPVSRLPSCAKSHISVAGRVVVSERSASQGPPGVRFVTGPAGGQPSKRLAVCASNRCQAPGPPGWPWGQTLTFDNSGENRGGRFTAPRSGLEPCCRRPEDPLVLVPGRTAPRGGPTHAVLACLIVKSQCLTPLAPAARRTSGFAVWPGNACSTWGSAWRAPRPAAEMQGAGVVPAAGASGAALEAAFQLHVHTRARGSSARAFLCPDSLAPPV